MHNPNETTGTTDADTIFDLEEEVRRLTHRAETAEQFMHGVWVNVYQIDRNYGGPEEGGWWFDSGHPVHTFQMTSQVEAETLAEILREQFTCTGERFSVAQRCEDYRVVVEGHIGTAWPETYPHYC